MYHNYFSINLLVLLSRSKHFPWDLLFWPNKHHVDDSIAYNGKRKCKHSIKVNISDYISY